MTPFQTEPEIDLYNQDFGEDLLNRKPLGDRLSNLVETSTEPLVIALHGGWGTGKTHFLKSWVGDHTLSSERRSQIVYFDAFKADYLDAPMVSLVGAITERLPPEAKPRVKKIKEIALSVGNPLLKLGLAAGTGGLTTVLSDVGDAAAKAASKEVSAAADQFWAKAKAKASEMDRFKEALEKLTTGPDDEVTPLVIVIDELDRCRPDYALSLLETIKHFFHVPHVHFVFGVNLNALESIASVRYGQNDGMTNYLSKFFSITLNLPSSSRQNRRPTAHVNLTYAKALCDEMNIDGAIAADLNQHLWIMSTTRSISLRDVGKIISLLTFLPGWAGNKNADDRWLTGVLTPETRSILIGLIIAQVIDLPYLRKVREGRINRRSIGSFFIGTHPLSGEGYDFTPWVVTDSAFSSARSIVDRVNNPTLDEITGSREYTRLFALWSIVAGERPTEEYVKRLYNGLSESGESTSVTKVAQKLLDAAAVVFGTGDIPDLH